jgi:hypothetical protein
MVSARSGVPAMPQSLNALTCRWSRGNVDGRSVVLARASEDDRVQDGCGVINVVEGERVPSLRQVVLDCTDARSLAEFYAFWV